MKMDLFVPDNLIPPQNTTYKHTMPSQKELFAAQKAAKEIAKIAKETAKVDEAKAAVKTAEMAEANKRFKAIVARRDARSTTTMWGAHCMETGRVVGEAQVADEIRYKNM